MNQVSDPDPVSRHSPLRQARLIKLWTIKDVADKINMDERTVLRWELGQQFPRLTSLQDLTRLFAMSAKDLGFDTIDTLGTSKEVTRSSNDVEPTVGNGGQTSQIWQDMHLNADSSSGSEVTPNDADPEDSF